MKRGKKPLSLLLALLLCLSLFPAALAQEPEGAISPVDPSAEDGPATPAEEKTEGTIAPAQPGATDEPKADASSGPCGENLTWTLDENGTLTVSGTGDMWSRCTEIPLWDAVKDLIRSVVILPGVTSIGNRAFEDCQNLSAVSIPEGVTDIGFYAFAYCSSLGSVTIPEGVTVLGYFPFSGCSSLTAVTIPASVKSVTPHLNGQGLFEACDSLRDIWFGGTIAAWKSLGVNPDRYQVTVHCSDGDIAAAEPADCGDDLVWTLSSEGVLTIAGTGDMWDFEEETVPWYDSRSEIKVLQIESGVTSIGDYAFGWCRRMTEADIPDTVSRIGSYAFQNCYALSSITLPESVRSIEEAAFYLCAALTHISIPEGVIHIGADVFSFCPGLMSVTLPSHLGSGVVLDFAGCGSLTDIYYGGTIAAWRELDAVYDRLLVTIHCSDGDIPHADSTHCGDDLTWTLGGEGLLTVSGSGDMWDFPNGTAPWYDSCMMIRRILLPSGLTGIGACAFSDCGELTELSLPDSLTRIGAYAFRSCSSLTEITIPASVTSLAPGAFEYCQNLTAIRVAPENPCLFSQDGVLYDREAGALLCWPCAKSGPAVIPDGVAVISDSAFSSCTKLTEVSIPEGLSSIGASAFCECRALTAVTIPASVTSLGSLSFSFCSALREIRFCGSAPSQDGFVFYRVTAVAYYPASDPSWTAERRQSYDGNLTWIPYLPGDANDDGQVDVLDLVRLRKQLAGVWVELNDISADLNGDGEVSILDLVRLRRLLAGDPS